MAALATAGAKQSGVNEEDGDDDEGNDVTRAGWSGGLLAIVEFTHSRGGRLLVLVGGSILLFIALGALANLP